MLMHRQWISLMYLCTHSQVGSQYGKLPMCASRSLYDFSMHSKIGKTTSKPVHDYVPNENERTGKMGRRCDAIDNNCSEHKFNGNSASAQCIQQQHKHTALLFFFCQFFSFSVRTLNKSHCYYLTLINHCTLAVRFSRPSFFLLVSLIYELWMAYSIYRAT